MATCRVVKGGWSWCGDAQQVGAVISGVSSEWVANRVSDGLVESVSGDIEEASLKQPETATKRRRGNS